MFDYTGTRYNFTVLEKIATHKKFAFYDVRAGAFDVSNVTFTMRLVDGEGEELEMAEASHAEGAVNKVYVTLPGMDAGTYNYEVVATADTGEEDVIVAGLITVKSRAAADAIVEEGVSAEEAEMRVVVPESVGQELLLKWQGSSFVEGYAEIAKESAEIAEEAAEEAKAAEAGAKQAVENAVAEATAKAKEYADEAKAAKDGVQDAINKAVADSTEEAKGYAEAAKESAADAAASAEDVKGSAKQIAEEATQATRDRLEELMDDTEETRQSADATVEKLEGFLAKFADNVRSVVWVNPENDHLIIGGVDTECKVSGDPGKSPYVDENGDWQYWDDESAQWRNGGPARGEDGFSPYIDGEWHLVYRDPLTGEVRRSAEPIKGKDGLDARQVRRMVVKSVDEIPQEGETCNGGYYYYVPLEDAPPVALFAPREERTVSGKIEVNGKVLRLPEPELSVEEAVTDLAGKLEELYPEADVKIEGEGRVLALVGWNEPYWAVRNLPKEDWDLTLHVRMKREGYDVYAWLENPNGEASWVHVGEANDLATTEVYGLTKLGTDAIVEDGAPVGTDETGNMRVPAADMAQRGTVRLSLNGRMEPDGGGIGVDETGRIWTRTATRTEYGVVKTSYTGSTEMVPVVGQNESGQLMVPYAGLNQPGVVRLGSYGGQANPIPYILSVGVDDNHRLANNLVYGGALQHINPQGWVARNMPWLDASKEAHPEYFQDLYYLGVVTSEQFTQNSEQGIILNSASASLKAGVFIARGIGTDERADAVPTAATVWTWANGRFYTKGEIDDKVRTIGERITSEVNALNETINEKEKKLSDRITKEVETLNTTITEKEKKLGERITTEVGNLKTTINDKEKALSDRINTNKDTFKNYKTWTATVEYLKSYATQSWVKSNYVTKEDFNKEKKTINDNIDKCVKKTATWEGCVYLTEDEYNALTVIDPKIEYNILGNSH